jgi:hypothetical protein
MKKSIFIFASVLFISTFASAQSLTQYTWDAYKTKFKIGTTMEVQESTGDYFSAGNYDINLTVSPQKETGMTKSKMEGGLRAWVKQNEVTVSSSGYKTLDDLNGYHGVMCDGHYDGTKQVFLMMVMDPDYTDIQLYVWIAYNTKTYDLALSILKSFTPM